MDQQSSNATWQHNNDDDNDNDGGQNRLTIRNGNQLDRYQVTDILKRKEKKTTKKTTKGKGTRILINMYTKSESQWQWAVIALGGSRHAKLKCRPMVEATTKELASGAK